MNMNKIHLDRLRKVAESTHEELLPESKFNFNKINDTLQTVDDIPHCGTLGCKMHLFPILFPNTFEYTRISIKFKAK